MTQLLSDHLRRATASAHATVESLPMPLAVASGRLDRSDWIAFLVATLEAVTPLERVLAMDATHDRLGLPAESHGEALRGDLGTLGGWSRPLPVVELRLTSPGCLGVLYVLEGSRLGGLVIARAVERALGPAAPVAYHRGAGASTTSRWRAVVEALDRQALDDGDRAAAVAGARAAFTQFASAYASLSTRPG